jgi:hypothetical protein
LGTTIYTIDTPVWRHLLRYARLPRRGMPGHTAR